MRGAIYNTDNKLKHMSCHVCGAVVLESYPQFYNGCLSSFLIFLTMVAPFPFSGVKISEELARDKRSKHPVKVTPALVTCFHNCCSCEVLVEIAGLYIYYVCREPIVVFMATTWGP